MRASILGLLYLLLCAIPSFGQSTTVSGTVTDLGGQPWNNGTYSFVFKPANSNPLGPYVWNGAPFSVNQTIQGNLSNTATFSVSVPSNTSITPSGSTWTMQFCPAATAPCFLTNLTITGATQSVSGIQPPAVSVNLANPPAGVSAYQDSEIVGAKTGSFYFNLSDSTLHMCSGFPPCTWVALQSTASILPATNLWTGANTWSQLGTFNAGLSSSGPTTLTGTTNISGFTSSGPSTLNGGGTLSGTWTGNPTLTGNVTLSGTPTLTGQTTITNPCAIDGVLYVSSAGCYATFAAALSQCKTQGSCIIDARGASSVTNIGTFDPNISPTGNASVTLLLGAYTYSVTQIVLRTNLNIIGSGLTNTSGTQATVLLQANAGTAPIALPASGNPLVTTVQGVYLTNFELDPVVGSTSDGISLIAGVNTVCSPQPTCQQTSNGGGLWYSTFYRIFIGGVNGGFGRNLIRADGTQIGNGSALQFVTFRDVWAYRGINKPPDLYITGAYMGQATFDGCEFDLNFGSSDTNSGLSNILIDDTPGISGGGNTWVPYSIKFQNTTIQSANGPGGVGLLVKGGTGISCDNCHFEHDTILASAVLGPGGHSSVLTVMNSYVDGFSGTGGLLNIDANSQISFHDNAVGSNPPPGGLLLANGSVPTFLQWYGNFNSGGGPLFSPLPEPGMTVAQLPPAADGVGMHRVVTDSTSISSEGQVCTHASSGAVTAIAISNGSQWKCF